MLYPFSVEDGGLDSSNDSDIELTQLYAREDPVEIEIVVDEGPFQLAAQALPSLLLAAIGSSVTGWMFNIFQYWEVFVKTPEFFILVPILFNLKGNLEMNLASRLSTAANLGLLSRHSTRFHVVIGNLALLQVQAFVVGTVSGFQSILLGNIEHRSWNDDFVKVLMVVTTSVATASSASLVLGSGMCCLVLTCFYFKINPDNVATPLASSLGDLSTLTILGFLGRVLYYSLNTYSVPILAISLLLLFPVWFHLAYTNKHVQSALIHGWLPLFVAMLLSSATGVLLESSVTKFAGLAVLVPVVNGVGGNIGAIYASRRSTFLHAGVNENYHKSMLTLSILSVPLLLLFLVIVYWFGLGHIQITSFFLIFIIVVGLIQVAALLLCAHFMVNLFWWNQLEPDDYVIPLLSAVGDIIGTFLLVGAFYLLVFIGDQNMLPQPT